MKELLDLRISIKGRGKYAARWYSKKGGAVITLFANVLYDESLYSICDGHSECFIKDLEVFFLIEYICACLMTGTGWKKSCAHGKLKPCIPQKVAVTMLEINWMAVEWLKPSTNNYQSKVVVLE